MTETTQATSSPQAPAPPSDPAAPEVPMTAAAGEGATTVRTTEELTPLGEGLRRATAGRYGPVRELMRSTLPADLMVRDPALSMDRATTSKRSLPSSAWSASSVGISSRQGTHQVAQTFRRITLPRKSSMSPRLPSSVS